MRKILAACGLLLLASLQAASAQSLNLIKVASCGTASYNVPYLTVDASGTLCTTAPVSSAGVAPVVSSALESNHVIKASPGVLISGYVTTGAVAGYLLVSDSTTAPSAGGAAIAPIACVYAPANATTSIGGQGGPAIIASTGITLVFSTSGCLTNTASATVFLSGQAL
jgi:hypothetical protein